MCKGGLRRVMAALVAVVVFVSVDCGAQAAVWRVVYELAGTQFDIRNTPLNLGNGKYDVGPGYLVVDYSASNGNLVDGPVQMRGFSLVQEFVATNPGATVVADLFSEANFSGQQTFATGSLSGGVLTWSEPFLYKVVGTNTCTGNFCNLAGFTAGVPRDDSREDPLTLNSFTFGSGGPQGGASFDGGETLLPGIESADTYLLLKGREIRREFVEQPTAPDSCLPYPSYGAHSADRDCDGNMSLTELIRVVQLYNAGQFHCSLGTEDSYQTGPGATGSCVPHTADFEAPAFRLTLTELLRSIQLFNLGNFASCSAQEGEEGEQGEDGYCIITN